MEVSARGTVDFSTPAARQVIGDLFQCRPAIFWTDLLVSTSLGYTAASIYFAAAPWSSLQVVSYLVAIFSLFRAGTFLHEIAHLPGKQMRSFKAAWNVLVGVPLMMPSFLYSNHLDHHSSKHYGTGHDGEYLPLGSGSLGAAAWMLLQLFLMPLLLFFRFAVLTPLSFLHPALRRWTLRRASSLVINVDYRRPLPRGAAARWETALELLCSARTIAVLAAPAVGMVSWSRPGLMYLLALGIFTLKLSQMVVAHRYRSDGQPISHTDQLADSVNLIGLPVLGPLFWPLGLRYHALHHLFPTLPYHNLTKAHRRLMAHLPAGSVYHRATISGGVVAIEILRAIWSGRRVSLEPAVEPAEWYRRRAELHGEAAAEETHAAPATLRKSTAVA